MSFIITKRKNAAWDKMVLRQQISDMLSYNQITTTLNHAKELKRHADRIITYAKKQTLAYDRKILSIILDTKTNNKQALLKKAHELAKKYSHRNGGYTRVLKLDNRAGDNSKMAIIQFVE